MNSLTLFLSSSLLFSLSHTLIQPTTLPTRTNSRHRLDSLPQPPQPPSILPIYTINTINFPSYIHSITPNPNPHPLLPSTNTRTYPNLPTYSLPPSLAREPPKLTYLTLPSLTFSTPGPSLHPSCLPYYFHLRTLLFQSVLLRSIPGKVRWVWGG